jgi:hypothetical protein
VGIGARLIIEAGIGQGYWSAYECCPDCVVTAFVRQGYGQAVGHDVVEAGVFIGILERFSRTQLEE